MANEYLVNIHNYLSEKIKESQEVLRSAEDKDDRVRQKYYKGSIYELKRIRKYLSDNFNLTTQIYY